MRMVAEVSLLKNRWIVNVLRIIGVAQLILCVLVGLLVGRESLSGVVYSVTQTNYSDASDIGMIIGGVLGFIVGIYSTLIAWISVYILQDLHAIRLNTSAYTFIEEKNSEE